MDDRDIANYTALIAALQLVALGHEEQIKALPDFVCVPDEIALIFDDSFSAAKSLIEANPRQALILELLEELDNQFSRMSDTKELWTIDALRAEENWKFCRSKATDILKALNETLDSTTLNFVTFVE